MRKSIIIIFGAIIIGALLGQWLIADVGYIYISFRGWSLETTLWLAVPLVLLFFIILRLALRTIIGTFRLPFIVRGNLRGVIGSSGTKLISRQASFHGSAQQPIRENLLHLLNEDYQQITKLSAKIENLQVTNDNMEAQLIYNSSLLKDKKYNQLIQNCTRITAEIQEGKFKNKKDNIKAFHLLMARAYMKSKDYPEALAIMKQYSQDAIKDYASYQLLSKLYIKRQDWNALGSLLIKSINKHPNKQMGGAKNITQEIEDHIKEFYANSTKIQMIRSLWQSLSGKQKANPQLMAAYCLAIAKNGQKKAGLEMLRKNISKNYDNALVDALVEIPADRPLIQKVKFLEAIKLNSHNEETIIKALAKISSENKLPGKAMDYYEKLLTQYPDTQITDKLAYADLLEKNHGDKFQEKAKEIYRSIALKP